MSSSESQLHVIVNGQTFVPETLVQYTYNVCSRPLSDRNEIQSRCLCEHHSAEYDSSCHLHPPETCAGTRDGPSPSGRDANARFEPRRQRRLPFPSSIELSATSSQRHWLPRTMRKVLSTEPLRSLRSSLAQYDHSTSPKTQGIVPGPIRRQMTYRSQHRLFHMQRYPTSYLTRRYCAHGHSHLVLARSTSFPLRDVSIGIASLSTNVVPLRSREDGRWFTPVIRSSRSAVYLELL